jgi:hypothetical protein
LLGTAGVIGGRQLQAVVRAPATAGTPEDFKDAHNKLQDDMYAVLVKHWWPVMASMGLRCVVSVLLLIGGLRTLSLRESGRKLLMIGCAVALPLEIGYAILQSLMNLENMTAMNSFAEKLDASMPQQKGMPAGTEKAIQIIIRGSMIAGLVIAYAIALAKIGVYVFSLIYLQKERIRDLFKTYQPTLTPDPLPP